MRGAMKKEEKEGAVRFSISLPTKLFEDLDEMVRAKQYLSRSEFIRDLIREKMVEGVLHGDGEDDCVGVLCIAYDHHQSDLIEQLVEIEHHANVTIVSTSHFHIDERHCFEEITMRDKISKIERLSAKIGALKGVKFSKLVKAVITEA